MSAVRLVGMPYIQPPWRTRKFFNRFAAAIGLGSAETLTVVGRFSKKPQKIPVSPIEVNGVRYLVSTYGESQWVKNVRANPTITLNGIEYLAAGIPVAARKPKLDVFKANSLSTSTTISGNCPPTLATPCFP
jgi:F420H(2)-dependent quinone reductase